MNAHKLTVTLVIISIFLALPMGLILAQTSVPDADQAATGVIEVHDASGTPGERIQVPVYIQVGKNDVQDYQFDLYFDAYALQYRDGNYKLGNMDSNWPVHDDDIIEPGHIRFGALDWASAIPAGSEGVLVTFFFTVNSCDLCQPGERYPLNLENPAGGINGYQTVDAYFLYEGPTTPTPTPTATPTPAPTLTPSGPALTTAFTYQGRLTEGGHPANGAYDLQFRLYSAADGGHQVGSTVIKHNVQVIQGLFTVELDFDDAFTGKRRWLEVSVRHAGSGAYTLLQPRQELTAAPYALALPGLRAQPNDTSPNIIGGHEGNSVAGGVVGATISGGGDGSGPNQVMANLGAIGGGGANVVSGKGATIPGGYGNEAQGAYSFAAGRQAKANADGCFVWGDGGSDTVCDTPHQTVFGADGGFYIYTDDNHRVGVYVSPGGGSWHSFSDRSTWQYIRPVDPAEVLTRLVNVPVHTWSYKTQDTSIRHMGPAAQDFYAAFGLGDSNKAVATIDAEGVAFAAIQGLYQQNQELTRRVAELEAQNAELRAQLQTITARLEALRAQEMGDER